KYSGDDDKTGLRLQINSDKVVHDLRLLDIQHRLKKFQVVKDYYTENHIRSNDDHSRIVLRDFLGNINPDGVIDVELNGGRFYIPIEYENIPKSKVRYESIFLKYYINSKIDSVLYVVHEQNVLNKLVNITKNITKNFAPKIFFVLFDELISSPKEVIFKNYFGQKIVLQ
ncbi:MAG: hypothetical protein HQK49_22625, partial [Oligoflexia bacterium]|nr:hypothetical protein [Oligoflexia bacterium]